MKNISNFITAIRIVLSPALLIVQPLSPAFMAVYIICGISDMADGIVARKTGTVSRFGARLDSVADLLMICVLLIVLLPFIKPPAGVIVWVAFVFIVRCASMFIVYIRFKTFAVLHTYGNKLTGAMLFLFPLSLPYVHTPVLMYIMCAAASISAVEETIIQSTSHELDTDRKSLFMKS
ncbi:MAG TPA: CDP-alcohol phosphatidyltransferase family protein [Clostridia bacterium]|nr:CDP-alcohol phosphatidyltransferase family protein [Clostridia bacterium]